MAMGKARQGSLGRAQGNLQERGLLEGVFEEL